MVFFRNIQYLARSDPTRHRLKHSSCSQYINDRGYSYDQLQILTDHARRDSVLKYAVANLETKRRLMVGEVIPLGWGKYGEGKEGSNNE